MKKLLSLALAACGGATPAESMIGCTPQEFIDTVNAAAQKVENDNIITIGSYPGSGEELKIASTSLTITLNENKDGALGKIHLYWYAGYTDEEVITSAGFYTSRFLNLLAPAEADTIRSSINEIVTSGSGSTEETTEEIKVNFESTLAGANRLDIVVLGRSK